MQSKFSLYDFLGYIIPGAFLTMLLVYLIGGILGKGEVLLTYVNGVGETIIFLVVSYVVGHVVQARGRMIEEKEKDAWGGYFSMQFLRSENDFYTSELKRILKQEAKSQFGLTVDLPDIILPTQEQKDKRYQEIFNLCYALVVQKGLSMQVDIHNAVYGMFRGGLAVREAVIFVSAIAAMKHATVMGIYWRISGPALYEPEAINLIISLFLLSLSLGVGRFLRRRLRHFAQRFVDSVYRNFLVYRLSGR